MNKYKCINTAYFYSFLILILICSTILSFPSTAVFADTGTDPTVSLNIVSPSPGATLNNKKEVIKGSYTNTNIAVPNNELVFKATDTDLNQPISDSANTSDWKIGDDGTWAFTSDFLSGTHNLSITITSTDNTEATQNISFIIDTRPYISSTGIVISDNKEYSGEDLTSIPPDAKIKISLTDDNPMTQMESKTEDHNNPFISVLLDSETTPIAGTTKITRNDSQSVSGKNVYDFVFTPSEPLSLNKTYHVSVNSIVLDDANNKVFPKYFKFTTKSDMGEIDNPHGHYQLNTNMCAACHSTHVDSPEVLNSDREGGSYLLDFNEKINEDTSSNYCTACHDGTLNAPKVDKITSKYRHDNPIDYSTSGENHLKQAESCTSCHNPHLEWSESNPNMLKDHYVYTHNENDKDTSIDDESPKLTTNVIDSLDTSCSVCHKDNMIQGKSIFDKDAFGAGNYEVLSYKKSTTAVGDLKPKIIDENIGKSSEESIKTVSDYSLCLRCHNGSKTNASNIEQYYVQKTSAHYFKLPADQTMQDDGSPLNGQLPCADCHETHGSSNKLLLKTKFGQENRDSTEFTFTDDNWRAGKEREFCLKCHNGNTALYGVSAKALDESILGHTIISEGTPEEIEQDIENKACSKCHGGESKSFLEAAHAPKMAP